MVSGPHNYYNNPGRIDAEIQTFLVQHGFNGFHTPVYCRWLNIEQTSCSQNNADPDPRTFEALESLITRVYNAGGVVHIWVWSDNSNGGNPNSLPGGINGEVDRRLQRYIAARLGPIPGWTMGYGFDLWEWTNGNQLTTWHDYMQTHFGLIALGHSVVVSDQRVAGAGDAAGKDLVIIAPDARRVGVHFRDVAVPVITMEVRLFSTMYLTGRRGGFGNLDNQSQVIVTNPSHPLAAGLSATVTTHSVPNRFYWGQPGAEAIRVASSADPNKVLIFAYESGASLASGKAQARRIAFYNGNGTSYTAEGWLLFRAAVEWSLGCS